MYALFLHVSSSLIIRNQPLWPGYCLDLISREFQESDNIKSSSLICEGSFLPRSVIHLPSKSHLLIVLHSHCSSSCINSILLVGIWTWQTLLYFCLLIYSLTHSFILCWVDACMLSRVWLFVTPLTVAHQAALSMGFSRQEYWRGLPFPTPGPLPDPRIEPASPAFAGRFFTAEPPEKPKDTSSHPNIPLVHSLNR